MAKYNPLLKGGGGSGVILGDHDTVERALRKFKKIIANSGLLNELRDRQHYVKPTTKRKLKKAAAKKRWERELQSQTLPKKLY
jgi:small subunit ribosomal protein S21